MKTNWDLYLLLTTSNLNDTCDVQKESVPFAMKLCTHLTYDSEKLKRRSDRSCRDVGPVSALCQQGEPADQSLCAAAGDLYPPPTLTNLRAQGLLLHFHPPKFIHTSFVVNPNLILTQNHRGNEFWGTVLA